MATTEGLTLATTSAILGNTGASLSAGGTHSESIWSTVSVCVESAVVEVSVPGGAVSEVDGVSMSDDTQPLLSERAKIRMAEIVRYAIFALFIADCIVAHGQK